jgi:hypothetical protein
MMVKQFFSYFSVVLFTLSSSFVYAEDSFFDLPSPGEILMDAESEGLKIVMTPQNMKVLRTDLKTLAKKNKHEAAFVMGRMFALAGFNFKKLSISNILGLANKMYVGTASLKLPPVINNEITGYYAKMLKRQKWERAELMIFFTSARSSLMFLMKDKTRVKKNEYPDVQAISCALELGMWFQSLSLALENLKPEQAENYGSVFIDEDILGYFSTSLKESLKHNKSPEMFKNLTAINDYTLEILKDEKVEISELNILKTKLSEVIK